MFARRDFLRAGFAFIALPIRWLQGPDMSWQADVKRMLAEFLSCQTPIDDKSPCNVFLARALKRVYAISDFDDPVTAGQFLSANQIATYVKVDSKWTFLGKASAQSALNEAQGQGNLKKAVVAVFSSPSHGHVCLVTPGQLSHSTTWGLDVPNSASFFLENPSKSYVSGPLSKAFGADKKDSVMLYGRNF